MINKIKTDKFKSVHIDTMKDGNIRLVYGKSVTEMAEKVIAALQEFECLHTFTVIDIGKVVEVARAECLFAPSSEYLGVSGSMESWTAPEKVIKLSDLEEWIRNNQYEHMGHKLLDQTSVKQLISNKAFEVKV